MIRTRIRHERLSRTRPAPLASSARRLAAVLALAAALCAFAVGARSQGAAPAAKGDDAGITASLLRVTTATGAGGAETVVKEEAVKEVRLPLRRATDSEGRKTASLAGKFTYDFEGGNSYRLRVRNESGGPLYLRVFDKDPKGTFEQLLDSEVAHGATEETPVFSVEKPQPDEMLIFIGSTEPIKFTVQQAGGATRGMADEDRARRTKIMANVGAFFGPLGEHDLAVEFYEYLLGVAREKRDAESEAALLNAIALAHHSVSRYDKALESYERALLLATARRDRRSEAAILSNLGLVYSALNRPEEAVRRYSQALVIQRELKEAGAEAITLGNLGIAYASEGRYAEALAAYNEALAVHERNGYRQGVGRTLNNLGAVNRALCQQALASGPDSQGRKRQAAPGGTASKTLPQPCAEALGQHARALAIAREVVDVADEGFALNNAGLLYDVVGDYRRAVADYQQALSIFRAVGNRAAQGLTLNNLMFAWRALGRKRPAIVAGKQAVNLSQEMRGEIRALDAESRQSFLAFRSDTYRVLADLLLSDKRLPEAEQVLRMLKEEEYFEFVRRDGGEASALSRRVPLTPEESAWEERARAAAGSFAARGRERGELLGKTSRTPAEAARLARLDAELREAAASFQQSLDQLAAELGDTKQAARVDLLRETESLMEDLRELGQGTVALYTVVAEEKYHVILRTPDVQLAREHPTGAEELARKVAAFREVLQDTRQDPRPLAQELYRIVVGPVAQDLEAARAETLMWSLDGVLRYIPVSALHDGERYMVERYRSVIFTPGSMSRLKDAPTAGWKGLGFGVSKKHGDFSELKSVPEELRGIIRDEAATAPQPAPDGAQPMPGKVMLDEAFTEGALRAALRERYPVVHIASHFAFRPGNEADSFLLMGDGRPLPLSEIRASTNLFGGVELLTLSACDTATGGAGADGREVEGFAMLAQQKGAKAVMASLWPVADQSTRLLMQTFYQARAAGPGVSKAEALRRAQLALLGGGGAAAADERQRGMSGGETAGASYAHPYFWAPFILIGNWR